MKKRNYLKRSLVCTAGVLASTTGIVLLTKSGLGTSQISSLPFVASFIFPVSLGAATFIMNATFVLIQFCMLRRDFGKREMTQIPLTFVFSICIDLMMRLFSSLAPVLYIARIALCLTGSAFIALGISLQLVSNIALLPGDGIVRLLSRKTGIHFGSVKTAFDLTLVAASLILSLACLHRVVGIREGTLIAALIVGTLTRFFLSRLSFLKTLLAPKN